MFSPTIRPESYSRGDKTAIELFLSGAGKFGCGGSLICVNLWVNTAYA
jgi:hypothetical protein